MPTTGPERGCLDVRWQGGPLLASNLRLRPPRADDAPAIAELAGDREMARWTAEVPHPYEPEMADAFIVGAGQKLQAGTAVILVVERIADGALVGCVEVRPNADEADSLGCWIGRPYWGLGYGTEAVRRVARFAFEDLGMAALGAAIMPDNVASGRVLEKAGFVRAGTNTCGHGRCQGIEALAYRLTRDDWAAAFAARPHLLVAAVAIADTDGRVLMAKRPQGKPLAGLWEFPGGKVHAGETPEAALVRELKEELGIDVTESCLAPVGFASHAYDDFHLLMPLFACRVWRGDLMPLEGQELRWVRPVRLGDLPLPPADAPLVATLRDLL